MAESQYVGFSLRVLLGPKFEYAGGGGMKGRSGD